MFLWRWDLRRREAGNGRKEVTMDTKNTTPSAPITPVVSDELIEQAQAAAARQASEFAPGERAALIRQIKDLLKKEDAVLVAHDYTSPELQQRRRHPPVQRMMDFAKKRGVSMKGRGNA